MINDTMKKINGQYAKKRSTEEVHVQSAKQFLITQSFRLNILYCSLILHLFSFIFICYMGFFLNFSVLNSAFTKYLIQSNFFKMDNNDEEFLKKLDAMVIGYISRRNVNFSYLRCIYLYLHVFSIMKAPKCFWERQTQGIAMRYIS